VKEAQAEVCRRLLAALAGNTHAGLLPRGDGTFGVLADFHQEAQVESACAVVTDFVKVFSAERFVVRVQPGGTSLIMSLEQSYMFLVSPPDAPVPNTSVRVRIT